MSGLPSEACCPSALGHSPADPTAAQTPQANLPMAPQEAAPTPQTALRESEFSTTNLRFWMGAAGIDPEAEGLGIRPNPTPQALNLNNPM